MHASVPQVLTLLLSHAFPKAFHFQYYSYYLMLDTGHQSYMLTSVKRCQNHRPIWRIKNAERNLKRKKEAKLMVYIAFF